MPKVLLHRKVWLIAGLLALDSAFFSVTDPHKVTAVVLFVGFLLLTATVYLCLQQLVSVAKLYGLPFSQHGRRIALFGTGVAATLIGLQSMGELSRRDLLVTVPMAIILYVYLSYGKAKASG